MTIKRKAMLCVFDIYQRPGPNDKLYYFLVGLAVSTMLNRQFYLASFETYPSAQNRIIKFKSKNEIFEISQRWYGDGTPRRPSTTFDMGDKFENMGIQSIYEYDENKDITSEGAWKYAEVIVNFIRGNGI